MIEELYSVSEAAKKLGITRTTVYNKLRQPEFESLVVTEKGQTMLTEDLINLIGESLKPKVTEVVEPKNHLEESLIKVVETLTAQLNMKDQQIQELNERLKEANAMNVNQQTLQLRLQQSQEEVKLIEEPKRKWWQR